MERKLSFLVLGLSLLNFLILADVEVAQLVGLLVASDDVEPVTELVLLQELLGQVLEIALGVGNSHTGDGDLGARGITADRNGVSELTGLAIDLELVVEEVLEGSGVEDGILDGAAAVDDELAGLLASSSGDALHKKGWD